jgi:hypothetical protein
MMSKTIRDLFEELKRKQFPPMGKTVGDFLLYDSLLAATACSFLDGAAIDVAAVPVPDKDIQETLKVLERKPKLHRQEAEFLNYAQLLDKLREKVVQAVKARECSNATHKPVLKSKGAQLFSLKSNDSADWFPKRQR